MTNAVMEDWWDSVGPAVQIEIEKYLEENKGHSQEQDFIAKFEVTKDQYLWVVSVFESTKPKGSQKLLKSMSSVVLEEQLGLDDKDQQEQDEQKERNNSPKTSSTRPLPSEQHLEDLTAMGSVPYCDDMNTTFSWAHCTGVEIPVRQPGKRSKKAPSAAPLFDCVGMDLLHSPKKLEHVMSKMKIPDKLKGTYICGVPTVLVINIMTPAYMKLRGPFDGEGMNTVMYFVMNKRGREQMETDSCPGVVLFKKFIEKWKTGNYHARLKCIPFVANPKDLQLGSFLSKFMKVYNRKPWLTGPKFHTFYEEKEKGYLEVDVDIHRFCMVARKVSKKAMDVVEKMITDVSFVVQGEQDEELPEQVLGAVRINRVNPSLAQRVML